MKTERLLWDQTHRYPIDHTQEVTTRYLCSTRWIYRKNWKFLLREQYAKRGHKLDMTKAWRTSSNQLLWEVYETSWFDVNTHTDIMQYEWIVISCLIRRMFRWIPSLQLESWRWLENWCRSCLPSLITKREFVSSSSSSSGEHIYTQHKGMAGRVMQWFDAFTNVWIGLGCTTSCAWHPPVGSSSVLMRWIQRLDSFQYDCMR